MNADKRDILIMPVAAVVLLGWAASLVVALLTQSYTALTITTPLMLMLAGYVFGVNIVRKGADDKQA
jgi:hypothetical protein